MSSQMNARSYGYRLCRVCCRETSFAHTWFIASSEATNTKANCVENFRFISLQLRKQVVTWNYLQVALAFSENFKQSKSERWQAAFL